MREANDEMPPVVCTLTLGKRAERELEWGDLAALALTQEEVNSGVASTYPLDLAPHIEDLTDRELTCCGSWLEITHERADDEFRLVLTTRNPDGLAMIRSLSGLANGD